MSPEHRVRPIRISAICIQVDDLQFGFVGKCQRTQRRIFPRILGKLLRITL